MEALLTTTVCSSNCDKLPVAKPRVRELTPEMLETYRRTGGRTYGRAPEEWFDYSAV